MNDGDEIRKMFFDEADEQIRRLTDGLLALEKGGGGRDLLDDVFRAAHTLKGGAGMMGFARVAEVVHRMENVLDLLRSDRLRVSPPLVDALFRALDRARGLIGELQAGGAGDGDIASVVRELAALEATPAAGPAGPVAAFRAIESDRAAAAELAARGYTCFRVDYRVDPAAPMASVNAFFILNGLKGAGEVIRSAPTEAEMEGDVGPDVTALVATRGDAAVLEALVRSTGMAVACRVEPFDEGESHEIGASPAPAAPAPAAADPAAASAAADGPAPSGGTAPSTILRIDSHRVDECVNLVGELVITLARFRQVEQDLKVSFGAAEPLRPLRDAVLRYARTVTDLQERTMSLRMVPVGQVFDRFQRVARDLSRALGKEIALAVAGGHTELDKTVNDELYEPLLHLVRNSADHGLEPSAERLAAGKPAGGTIALAAVNEGNHVILTLSDDGRGLDLERIRAKAVERGLVAAGVAAGLTEGEVIDFIFAPGFSTAARVDDLSGRGVGLDVVRRSVERLKGSIEVASRRGEGTRFTIRLPLSLAILPALLVRVAGECFAIPLTAVVELVRPPRDRVRTVEGREVLPLPDGIVPLLRLDRHYRLRDGEPPDDPATAGPLSIAIVRALGRSFGLVVDGFVGERSIVLKALDRNLIDSPDISGASILGNGRVILVLDTGSLVARACGLRHA